MSNTPHPTPPPQDKIDESEDKEAILGADILNPTTGLSLKDYLEGREQDHNELIARALLGEEAFKDDHTTYLDSEVRWHVLCVTQPFLANVQYHAVPVCFITCSNSLINSHALEYQCSRVQYSTV